MALRNQPYLPLYVQDFLTDEKLIECSAESNGVYIRIMCVMHKSKEYGTILLQQKDQQDSKQINNFAAKLLKHLPYDLEVIKNGLEELIFEDVLQIDGDKLLQKRMIRDNDISIKRSKAGSRGGFATANKSAKDVANPETETETETEDRTRTKTEKIAPYIEISLMFHQYQQKEGLHHTAFKDTLTEESPIVENGADTIRLLIEQDGESLDEIKKVLTFVVRDGFWGGQVISLNGLRKRGKNGNIKYFNAKNAMQSSGGDMDKTMKMISDWGNDG